jgi:hypothetical protein
MGQDACDRGHQTARGIGQTVVAYTRLVTDTQTADMNTRHHEKPRARWSRYGFENLLVWLFLFLIVRPFLAKTAHADVAQEGNRES